ncbi:MAG: hypothetical protein U9R50_07705 [Campylobacterota bacterium]|nr:hypothetical protein [Campylobacterota bacterium]
MDRIHLRIQEVDQIYKRYKLESTFAMLYHEEALPLKELSNFLRVTDHFIVYDDHHYFIIYMHTSQEHAYKASENLLHNLDNYFNNKTTCIAIDTLDANNSSQIVLKRLMQILDEIKKHSYLRVANEDIFDELDFN